MKLSKTLLIAVALGAMSLPASAESTAGSPVQATLTIDPARLAAANDLLDAMGMNDQISAMLGQMFGPNSPFMKSLLEQAMSENPTFKKLEARKPGSTKIIGAKISEITGRHMQDLMQVMFPRIIQLSAEIYASELTADEMKAVTEFYRSPAGRRIIDVIPSTGQKMMAAMPAIMADLKPQMEIMKWAVEKEITAELKALEKSGAL